MIPSAMLLCDFYKISHREQYPKGTELVYSTWTPRESRIEGVDKVVFFGLQAFIKKYLINYFQSEFFIRDKKEVIDEYTRIIKHTLGSPEVPTKHIEDLHDLGHLPLLIKALPEGTKVPLRVPMFTIENTDPRFFWLTNYLETLISCELWKPCTSATIAHRYRELLNFFAKGTGGDETFVDFQAHDFSMRGMPSMESGALSGAGHLLSFSGTDTITAIQFMEAYYNANVEEALIGTSIPATEHSVMCAHGQDELATYTHLITKVYPTGFVSIVSDTWDLWKVLDNVITPLKDTITARDGKVVIRPDSGDPVKIICGNPQAMSKLDQKGVVEALWDIFGGTVNKAGYKELDPHIGCIYGDAITYARCKEINEKLVNKGFASTNVVYGIGSFTYQHNTRDTFGFAMKSTYCRINGEEKLIFKNPITDDGTKKSQRGMVAVVDTGGALEFVDKLSSSDMLHFEGNLMVPIFKNGKLLVDQTFAEIKERVNS